MRTFTTATHDTWQSVPAASEDFPTATASFDTQLQLTPCPSPLPLDEVVSWTPEQAAIGLSFFPDAASVAPPSSQVGLHLLSTFASMADDVW